LRWRKTCVILLGFCEFRSGRPEEATNVAGQAKMAPAKWLEQRFGDAADALRGNQEPSEYKHVGLGLVFLKSISDRFETRFSYLLGLEQAVWFANGVADGEAL
jgi:hypothetical protein